MPLWRPRARRKPSGEAHMAETGASCCSCTPHSLPPLLRHTAVCIGLTHSPLRRDALDPRRDVTSGCLIHSTSHSLHCFTLIHSADSL
eukprot:3845755-Rhodomonas_salina.1